MKDLKHSKGEWFVSEQNLDLKVKSRNSMMGTICILNDIFEEEAQANAKLIASAPKLLEALQTLLKEARANSFELHHNLSDTPAEQKAAEVIKQATE